MTQIDTWLSLFFNDPATTEIYTLSLHDALPIFLFILTGGVEMKQRPAGRPSSSDQIIRDINRKTRKQYGAEEKIRIVPDGLRGEDSIAELCRREGIVQSL